MLISRISLIADENFRGNKDTRNNNFTTKNYTKKIKWLNSTLITKLSFPTLDQNKFTVL